MSNSIKILVVDDEIPARKKVLSFLNDVQQNILTYEAENGIEAVEKIFSIKPDLIFLDIQMPGMDGFEVLKNIDQSLMPVIVFVTAFDQYAIDAFEVNAIDYLLKPFDKSRFEKSFAKALEKFQSKNLIKNNLSELIREIGKEKKYSERFLVNQSSKYFFVQANEIIYISSEEKYVKLHTSKTSHLLRETMNNMEEKLDAQKFARIHRSYIVNTEQIKEMLSCSHGDYQVILKTGEKLPMSRRYKDKLLA